MELAIFARFHAIPGHEDEVKAAILDVLPPTRDEPACRGIAGFRSVKDPQLFYLHSRWENDEAFDIHAELPHTVHFIQRVRRFIDHPLDINRTKQIR